MNDRIDKETGEVMVRDEFDREIVNAKEVFSLSPRNLAEALELAKYMAESDVVPKQFKGKPADCLIAVQLGAELGLKPLASLRGIAVINGRPSLYGDALWGLVRSHPLCEKVDESFNAATMTATCMVKRKGAEPIVRTFSKLDAEKAGLWTKDGPWKQYPQRMLQMRARGFACRDAIPEAMQGLPLAEEARDMEKDVTPGQEERLAAEMSIRNAIDLDELRRIYDGLTSEDQIRLTGLVAEMKRKLKGQEKAQEPDMHTLVAALDARGKGVDTREAAREFIQGPDIKDVRALVKKGDLDAAIDLAKDIADPVVRKVAEEEVMAALDARARK